MSAKKFAVIESNGTKIHGPIEPDKLNIESDDADVEWFDDYADVKQYLGW